MKSYRLIDLYKNPRKNGIFYSLSTVPKFSEMFNLLGYNSENDYHSMDIEYIYNHSGLKTASTLIEQFLRGYIIDDYDEFVILKDGKKVTWEYVMTQVDQDIINFIIIQKFANKWLKLLETLNKQFDILSPYSMSYDRTFNEELLSKDDKSRDNKSNSNTEINRTSTSNQKDTTFGFNSTNGVPSNASNIDDSSNDSNINNSSYNTKETDNYNRKSSNSTNIMRKGNIGNKSNQQLIEETRRMLEWQLYDVIFNDLDSVLTRSKYI